MSIEKVAEKLLKVEVLDGQEFAMLLRRSKNSRNKIPAEAAAD